MKFINIESRDVYTNVATDEYFLIHKPMRVFTLWINDNCIVLGKNQNSYKEINHQFVSQNNIKVVRRLTGGGAVFHDQGNLNFTFIEPNAKEHFLNFHKFLTPIVKALEKFGIKATISGRNDILIDNKKFSGNAQYLHNDWLLHHGTIMFSVSMSDVMQALQVNPLKMQAKGIASIKSRVTNVKEHLQTPITIEQFRAALATEMFHQFPEMEQYHLTAEDKAKIKTLRDQKYATWEHNFGKNPQYEVNHTAYIAEVGIIDIYLNIQNNTINDIKIYGDFFAKKSLDVIEKTLINLRYDQALIQQKLQMIENFNDYFHNLKVNQLTDVIMGNNLSPTNCASENQQNHCHTKESA